MLPWNTSILATRQKNTPDVVELLTLFSSELSKSASKFYTASLTENINEAMNLCHQMRGSAATFGFTKLSECLLEAENLIEKGTLLPSSIASNITAVALEISRRTSQQTSLN
jgi:HPt (histidine-containing phosphotransfer) domain-containing protein